MIINVKTSNGSYDITLKRNALNEAKDILKTHNVSDTAILCGFSNTSYFSVTFKEYTGMTPMQYKTNILKETR